METELMIDTSDFEGRVTGQKSCEYVTFWLNVILDAVVHRDIDYFESNIFVEHYNLLPDKYLASSLGIRLEDVNLVVIRKLLLDRCRQKKRPEISKKCMRVTRDTQYNEYN